MRIHERMLCTACAPRKLQQAEMTYRRRPARDGLAVCAFCTDRREKPCKCWQILTEKDK